MNTIELDRPRVDETAATNVATPAVRRTPAALVTLTLVGLAVTAWIHAAAIGEKYSEVPYLGVGYVLLVIASIVAGAMILTGRRRGWQLAVAACAATIVGFVMTRTVGLPASTDDIGNWGEPAGIYALIAEGAVVACGAVALGMSARRRPAR